MKGNEIERAQQVREVVVYRGGQHEILCDGTYHYRLSSGKRTKEGRCSAWVYCPNRR